MTTRPRTLPELTAALVAIDSVNPSLVPGGAGERAIADFVAAWLTDAGLDTRIDDLGDNRCNVVAIARGTGGGKSLMLNAHMDTVGYGGMTDPLTPRTAEGKLHGRGAFDMKASLAAIMLVGEEAARASWRGDLIITAVADEEFASIGTARIAETLKADAAIVTEPTDLELCVAHKGFAWLEVTTRGVAAHGSLADVGVDAIAAMGPVLSGIGDLQLALAARPPHPLLGPPSVHASLVSGGTELSTYPDICTVGIERRTIPGEIAADVEDEIGQILLHAAERDPRLRAEITMGLVREPFEIEDDHPFVALVRETASNVLNAPVTLTGGLGWMDSALLAEVGIPTVIFGPHGDGAHADEEWVDLASAEKARAVYAAVAAAFCA